MDQGRLNEAEQLQVQIMEIRKKLHGAEHLATLTSMANLAITYRNQGRLSEAEHLFRKIQEVLKHSNHT